VINFSEVGRQFIVKIIKKLEVLLNFLLTIAIGVSLLASRSVIVHTANSATLVTKTAVAHQGSQPLKLRLLLTAYVPDEGTKTATGRNANHPGIAADFKTFPPGTKTFIPGKGTFGVDDTGGAMRKDAKHGIHHIDLRIIPTFNAYHRAMTIGRQWIDAYVIFPPSKHSPRG